MVNTRNPDRLNNTYLKLCEIHKKSFPDMREGQYLLNLLGWINSNKHLDPFFIEGQTLITYAKEYANSNSVWYHGWNILNREEN